MKKIAKHSILFLTALQIFALTMTQAQTPEKMSYQSLVRDNFNSLLINQQVAMRISILQGNISGTAVFVETHNPVTNANGLVSIEIGSGILVSGSFSSINWPTANYYIKTEIDPNGGTNYSISGTNQLLSVPYALHAKTAESILNMGNGVVFTHFIGEQYGGGVIFHLWKDAQGIEHGLIVDVTDLSTTQDWSNIGGTAVGTAAQSTWDGLANSNAIVAQSGHTNSAASLCLNSTNGGQTDWYLPSVDELSLLWHNRFNVNKSLSLISGATVFPRSAYYWSSTENLANTAFYFLFYNGDTNGSGKLATNAVRAVRSF